MAEGPRLLSFADASRACGGLSESSLRRRIADKRFPSPVVLSRTKKGKPARVAFVASEVEQAISEMIAAARATGPEAA